jgi:uncharacterized protein YndB with AHSA1/START domain
MMLDALGSTAPTVQMISPCRAPRDKVFRTWTDPALIARWFMAIPGYLPALAEVNLAPLGAWKITVRPEPDRNHSILHGNFVDVAIDRELTYTWAGNVRGGEYYTLVNVRFEDDGEGSRVVLSHGVFRTDEDREAHARGWTLCLEGFHRLLEEAAS